MTSTRPMLLLVLAFAAAGLCVGAAAQRMSNADAQLSATQANLNQAASNVQRVLDLRSRQQTIAERKRPDQDVIARVNAVLAELGIPSDRFGGLHPDSDASLPPPGKYQVNHQANRVGYRRQSVRVTLNDLSVAQIGEFLNRWVASQSLWIPTRIELTHSRNSPATELYAVTMLLSATYVAREDSR